VAAEIESAVMALALAEPTRGQVRVANELRKTGQTIFAGGRTLRVGSHDLETTKKRLRALEVRSRRRVVTERSGGA